MSEDKTKRYEALDKLIDVISHGKATITWTDKTVQIVEDIKVAENCKISK